MDTTNIVSVLRDPKDASPIQAMDGSNDGTLHAGLLAARKAVLPKRLDGDGVIDKEKSAARAQKLFPIGARLEVVPAATYNDGDTDPVALLKTYTDQVPGPVAASGNDDLISTSEFLSYIESVFRCLSHADAWDVELVKCLTILPLVSSLTAAASR